MSDKNTYSEASEFWSNYAKRKDVSVYSLMNLQPDEQKAKEKFAFETNRVKELVNFQLEWHVLDLGGGVGLWSEYFRKHVAEVTLVERESEFIEIAKNTIKDPAIHIELNDVVEYDAPADRFDAIFISGVTIYLNDEKLNELMVKMKSYLKEDGIIIHRDAYGVEQKFVLSEKYSENLKETYSAMYRTRSEYDAIIADGHGFEKTIDVDMYEDTAEAKRWKETNLRVAIYRNIK